MFLQYQNKARGVQKEDYKNINAKTEQEEIYATIDPILNKTELVQDDIDKKMKA